MLSSLMNGRKITKHDGKNQKALKREVWKC